MSDTDPKSEVKVVNTSNGSATAKSSEHEAVDVKGDKNENGDVVLAKEKGDAAEIKKLEDVTDSSTKEECKEQDDLQNKQQEEAKQEAESVKHEDIGTNVQENKGQKVEDVDEVKDGESKNLQENALKEAEELNDANQHKVTQSECKVDENKEGKEEEAEKSNKVKSLKSLDNKEKLNADQGAKKLEEGDAKDGESEGIKEHGNNKEKAKKGEINVEQEDRGKEVKEMKEDANGNDVKAKTVKEHEGKGKQVKEKVRIQDEHKDKGEESLNEKGEADEEMEEHGGKDDNEKEDEEEDELEEDKEDDENEEVEGKDELEKKKENETDGRKRKRSKQEAGKKGESKGKKGRKKAKEVLQIRTPSSIDRPQRERKTVQRLVEVVEKEPAKKFIIEKGQGTPLKDIPNVAYKLSKWRTDDIKFLHLILFGKKGKAIDFKNHVSQFSGFVWHGDEGKQRARVKEKLDKCVKDKLLDLCDVFDMHVSRTTTKKEDLVTQLLDFLAAPRPLTDVLLEEKEQHSSRSRKRKGSSGGRASKSLGSSAKRPRKRQAKDESTSKSKERNISASESEGDDEQEEPNQKDHLHEHEDAKLSDRENENESEKDEERDEHDENSDSSGDETKKSTKRKSSAGRKQSKGTPRTKSATPSSSKSVGKTTSSKRSKSEDTTGYKGKVFSRKKKVDETPQKKSPSNKLDPKAKSSGKKVGKGKGKSANTNDGMPSKEQLRKKICEILKEVDFNTATFTDILKQLADHFYTNLTPKKVAIKLMIQEELTKLAEADEIEEDEDDEDGAGNEGDDKKVTTR